MNNRCTSTFTYKEEYVCERDAHGPEQMHRHDCLEWQDREQNPLGGVGETTGEGVRVSPLRPEIESFAQSVQLVLEGMPRVRGTELTPRFLEYISKVAIEAIELLRDEAMRNLREDYRFFDAGRGRSVAVAAFAFFLQEEATRDVSPMPSSDAVPKEPA
jgi:hypothetical protein